jgi:hypothetical protein
MSKTETGRSAATTTGLLDMAIDEKYNRFKGAGGE